MDFRISEYDSAIAMPRDDDVSSILAPTATLLKALEEFSDDEDECQYKKEEKEVNTVKCEFSFQSEEQDLESKKSTFFSPIRNHAHPSITRRKLDASPSSMSVPVNGKFNRLQSSVNPKSPPFGLFTPTASIRSLPNDFQLSLSSDTLKGSNEGGSLEQSVSSLNVALDELTKENTASPPRKRKTEFIEEHHLSRRAQEQPSPRRAQEQPSPRRAQEHHSPQRIQEQPSPQRPQLSDTHQNKNNPPKIKSDTFAVPVSAARPHNGNGISSNFRDPLTPDPPREQDTISINNHDYTVLKEVGRGSSGKVFQVMSHSYKQIYALKWIEVKRPEERQSIMNEIQLLRSLDAEDNTICLFDYFTTPSVIYMVMEFGEIDLAQLIQKQTKKKWDVNFVRYYWNQMLHSVNAIHKKGIVHSDLKPANFVLVKGWLKLIDFGIAKRIGDDTTNIHRGFQVGTINYMAPEALRDVNEGRDGAESLIKLGRPSDVWSLGCILYQMVYGKTPFYHLPLAQKVISIPNPEYMIPFPPTTSNDDVEVPSALLTILKTCLDRNPLLRPPLNELMSNPFVNN